jgi:hypothetical protein
MTGVTKDIANNRQVGGEHYKGGIEHWDYVAANGLDYFQAQITKYVSRCHKKNGLQDLHKAQHFLEKYIELAEAKQEKMEAMPDHESANFLTDSKILWPLL